MSDVLLFVHGTGVRNVSETMFAVRDGARRALGMAGERVVAVEWGAAVGPGPFDVSPALPPARPTRGAGGEPPDPAAVWELLRADPFVEVRVLAAAAAGPSRGGFDPTREPAGSALLRALELPKLPADALVLAGVSAEDVRAAARAVVAEPDTVRAAAHPDADEAVVGLARAVVAVLLARTGAPAAGPGACDGLADAIAAVLQPGAARGVGGTVLRRVVGPLATRLAAGRRVAFTQPACDFARDIAFYLAHGDAVRGHIAEAIAEHQDARRVVVLGHSLGGIAAVDLLSGPTPAPTGRAVPRVDLLVTVGSQAPLLYLMGALARLAPGDGEAPFAPWTNVYDPADLLAFCAERVFAGHAGVRDEPVDSGLSFPSSHSGYWQLDRTYEIVAAALGRLEAGR